MGIRWLSGAPPHPGPLLHSMEERESCCNFKNSFKMRTLSGRPFLGMMERRVWRHIFMTEKKRVVEKDGPLKKGDLIVITGGGGFIGGNLALYFRKKGFTNIRAVDKKPLYEWYLHVPGVQNLCLDVSEADNCRRVCAGAVEVYNLAADMGAWDSSSGFASNAFGRS